MTVLLVINAQQTKEYAYIIHVILADVTSAKQADI
jgi:hypothetical protein